ncbi:hypothetical protein SG34_024035 [Thalassomonas viridans]|uniref:Ferric oxidoreductase domain-containing protein n=1 Tax=Thalassomonas viridans TaxID=137584 RepID=A0AAF0C6N0_9GAMM|nr:hypothetical protein [Thalassomonas viridans]WDE04377.1 hypothetical protein SG34_024035 [Thalassomonas viridans]
MHKFFQKLLDTKHHYFLSFNLKYCILLFPLAYAIVRYNLAAGVEWSQLPLYITNKALAMSSVLALLFAARAMLRGCRKSARSLGKMALHCAWLHVLLTLVLLPAGYYPKLSLFVQTSGGEQVMQMASFSATANLALLFGLLCAYLFFVISNGQVNGLQKQILLYLQICTLAYHLLFLGGYSWFAPGSWPAYLPPITLLSFTCVLLLAYFHQKVGKKR